MIDSEHSRCIFVSHVHFSLTFFTERCASLELCVGLILFVESLDVTFLTKPQIYFRFYKIIAKDMLINHV